LHDAGAFRCGAIWSWSARNNKILCAIRVKMRLAGLPATNERFLLKVVPAVRSR
jgi:hypothetical protein